MKTDAQLRADVTDELAWDPAVNASNVGVIVQDGVVTLTGHLDSFAEKHAAERAVRRVGGVRGIAIDLEVKLPASQQRSDAELALAASAALRLNSLVPEGQVQVQAENGWITLTGEVEWGYQFASAEQSIRPLPGVRGIYNRITIKARVDGRNIGEQITAALTRQAAREARHIDIKVEGGVVTLSGKVHSMAEHDAALGVAFSTKGVSHVVDHLQVTG
ncbi:BON domain-containing protein [Ramlibacter sp.]|uniref:BON domain-containing protein n=1 Tax=Ramlibacter sp. TaxID=1917967 RepID=UPI002B5D13E9|nr:BON domain-containing protein [Ramlibacter sp.]HWI81117.1 BON domain-containing protein [Ramlibacter sp.]